MMENVVLVVFILFLVFIGLVGIMLAFLERRVNVDLIAAHELRIKTLNEIVASEQAARGGLVKAAVVWKRTAQLASIAAGWTDTELLEAHAQALQEYEGAKP